MQENGPAIVISVPSYTKTDDHVHYVVSIQNLKNSQTISVEVRYSELKKLHDSLETLKAPLPKFPSTNWWRATNSSPELIEERREQLDEYFRQVLSTKVVRESLILKNFVLEAQKDYEKKLEKEQRHKLQDGDPSKKKKNKFATPACQPVQEPIEDTRERAQSHEDLQPQQVKSNPSSRKNSGQFQQLNFGGTKIFRGIISSKTHNK